MKKPSLPNFQPSEFYKCEIGSIRDFMVHQESDAKTRLEIGSRLVVQNRI